jgi:hypothetical protein
MSFVYLAVATAAFLVSASTTHADVIYTDGTFDLSNYTSGPDRRPVLSQRRHGPARPGHPIKARAVPDGPDEPGHDG